MYIYSITATLYFNSTIAIVTFDFNFIFKIGVYMMSPNCKFMIKNEVVTCPATKLNRRMR